MIGTVPFDAAEHLAAPEAQAFLLRDAFTSGDWAYIDHALRIGIRARRLGGYA